MSGRKSFTGINPKDNEPLVGINDEPIKHDHGIKPQYMTEPRTPEEESKPLGYQIHKPPSHPTIYPKYRLGDIPSHPALDDYRYRSESPFERTRRKFGEAPIVGLGIAGLFGVTAFGIYKFKQMPKTVSASSYFVQLRVLVQTIAVGSISALAFYHAYKVYKVDHVSHDPIREAQREGRAFILNPEDAHHKSVVLDSESKDTKIQ